MHVSGTLLLTQEGREGSQRELQWVLERQGNQTLWLCVCACVRVCVCMCVCVCVCVLVDTTAHHSCTGWQKGAGAKSPELFQLGKLLSSSHNCDTTVVSAGKLTHAKFQQENLWGRE